jgi:hypothetical protein
MLPLDDGRLPWHKSPAKLAVLLLLSMSAGLVLAALLLQLVLEKSPNQGWLSATTASRLIKVGHATVARIGVSYSFAFARIQHAVPALHYVHALTAVQLMACHA